MNEDFFFIFLKKHTVSHAQVHVVNPKPEEHAHTYLHVRVSVVLAGITSSSLRLSMTGGVIEKPITRPVGTNEPTALASCYTGQSGPSVFDRAAGKLSDL